jgi:hypothetical protein
MNEQSDIEVDERLSIALRRKNQRFRIADNGWKNTLPVQAVQPAKLNYFP